LDKHLLIVKYQVFSIVKFNPMPHFPFLSHLAFTRLRITFEAVEAIVLPPYKGSAFRGCLGEALRAEVCDYRGGECDHCPKRFACAFSRLFNSYVEPSHPHHRKYTKSPHPYIINPLPDHRTEFEPGHTFGFELTLVGKAAELLPAILSAVRRMGETGIGKGRKSFKAIRLEALNNRLEYEALSYFSTPCSLMLHHLAPPTAGHTLHIELENPLRLMQKGKPGIAPPAFDLFAARVALRMALLAHFYCDAPWWEPPVADAPTGIQLSHAQVQEVNWQRYSGTQDTTMSFDGLVGQLTYRGENLAAWMPLLTMGSWLHAGATATFGLGRYSLAVE
jgi:hypothetical protein